MTLSSVTWRPQMSSPLPPPMQRHFTAQLVSWGQYDKPLWTVESFYAASSGADGKRRSGLSAGMIDSLRRPPSSRASRSLTRLPWDGGGRRRTDSHRSAGHSQEPQQPLGTAGSHSMTSRPQRPLCNSRESQRSHSRLHSSRHSRKSLTSHGPRTDKSQISSCPVNQYHALSQRSRSQLSGPRRRRRRRRTVGRRGRSQPQLIRPGTVARRRHRAAGR